MPSGGTDGAPEVLVTFVNRFTLRASDEEFERAFAQTSRFMREQPGLVRSRLMKEVGPEHHYVNIAEWSGLDEFKAAIAHPDFPQHAAALRALSSSEHNLYRTSS